MSVPPCIAHRSALLAALFLGSATLGSTGTATAAPAKADYSAGPRRIDRHHRDHYERIDNGDGLADLVQALLPAVVQVQVRHIVPPAPVRVGPGEMARGQMFQPYTAAPPLPEPTVEKTLGSGFIVDSHGVIVTNNHVVVDGGQITVKLADERERPAVVVGRDELTDLAVLRIADDGEFPTVRWGDSGTLRIGDSVIAVGSPFGLGGTVTKGIVSGRGRQFDEGPYDDLLQIDAAINHGNSGGPLFDNAGRVVGVNTAMFSPNGGSVGIGFAIPSHLARMVVDQIINKGEVVRGQIGIAAQSVTPDVADSLGLAQARGALVANVAPGSPAERAGLRTGDIVTRFDGRPIEDARALLSDVEATEAGRSVQMAISRAGETLSVNVTVAAMPRGAAFADPPTPDSSADLAGSLSVLGLTLRPTTQELNLVAGHAKAAHGLMVIDVDGVSDSADRGIQAGDLIVAVNNVAVDDLSLLASNIESAIRAGRHDVLLTVNRGSENMFVLVPLD